jgi:hypothetical protein
MREAVYWYEGRGSMGTRADLSGAGGGAGCGAGSHMLAMTRIMKKAFIMGRREKESAVIILRRVWTCRPVTARQDQRSVPLFQLVAAEL